MQSVTKLQKNLGGFILVALGAWCLLSVTPVANAFWAFVLLGEVPGTTHLLAPETVMRLALGVLAAIVVVVFRKKFLSPFMRRPAQPLPAEVQPLPAKAKTRRAKPAAPAVVVTLPATAKTRFPWQNLARRAGWGASWMLYGVILLAELLEIGVRSLGHESFKAWKVLQKVLVQLLQQLKQLSWKVWITAEPYMRRFDNWLNRKLHSYKRTADILEIGGQCCKAVLAYSRKLGNLLDGRN